MVFPVVMYGFERWTMKKADTEELMLLNWCYRRLFKSPLDWKEIKPVNPKGNESGIFIRTDAEAPILWPPDVKSQFIRP